MELIRITAQSGRSLRQFYHPTRWSADQWAKLAAPMLELVTHLEEDVSHSPLWAFTSHEDLVFSAQDDYRQGTVRVHPLGKMHGGPAKARFEVCRPIDAPWSHAVGYAEDVQQAWRLIRDALPAPPA